MYVSQTCLFSSFFLFHFSPVILLLCPFPFLCLSLPIVLNPFHTLLLYWYLHHPSFKSSTCIPMLIPNISFLPLSPPSSVLAHCFVPATLPTPLTPPFPVHLSGLWRVNVETWYPTLCCLQISIKEAQLSITASTPDVACISTHCRCNGPECCSLRLHWHPSCAMQHQRKNKWETESETRRGRCVIILHYDKVFYFPQQQRTIPCQNDSYQSKDGRSDSETGWRFAGVSLFSCLWICVHSRILVCLCGECGLLF